MLVSNTDACNIARGSHSPVFFRVARVGGAQRPHVHVAHASSPGPAVCRPGPADAAARVPAAFARVAAIPDGPRIRAAPAAASAATATATTTTEPALSRKQKKLQKQQQKLNL